MSRLEDLVRFESAHSGLAFREHAYARRERAALVRDVLALANASVAGPRYLLVGVREGADGERHVPGISERAWSECRHMLAGVADLVEPQLGIAARALDVDGALVGVLCLTRCEDPPYLVGEGGSGDLRPGSGWVRRGTHQRALMRRDLERMFETRRSETSAVIEPRVVFAGDGASRNELTLSALPLDALPSAVAAGKVRQLLEAKSMARDLGQTTTKISRLVHAQVFGVDEAYEPHSDGSLRIRMTRAEDQFRAADEHYRYEQRAHPLELAIDNRSERALHDVTLSLKLPKIDGVGVAERPYGPAGAEIDADGYPLVSTRERTIGIRAQIGDVGPAARVRAFGTAPRLWLREAAAGKTLPLDYTLHARELTEPLRDVLLIRVESA